VSREKKERKVAEKVDRERSMWRAQLSKDVMRNEEEVESSKLKS